MKTTRNDSFTTTKRISGNGPGFRANGRPSLKHVILAAIAMSLGVVYAGAAPVGTAELSLPTVRTSAGSSVATSLEFRAQGTAVSALLFDLQYDPGVLSITPAIGNSAEAADKFLFYNVLPQPDGKANLRILIFGLNQTAIEDGSLVDLSIEVSANSSSGAYPVEFFDVSLASPDAEAVPFQVHSGRVVKLGQP